MYLVQKRKSEKSQWHTVKNMRGRKICSEDIASIKGDMDELQISFPRFEFRIIDNATGEAVTVFSDTGNGGNYLL